LMKKLKIKLHCQYRNKAPQKCGVFLTNKSNKKCWLLPAFSHTNLFYLII